jgi:hypothetical protein
MSKRYSLQLKAEEPFFDDHGRARIIPAKIVSFQEGRFITSDAETATQIRESLAFKQGKILEITDQQREMFMPATQKTVRGPISAGSLHAEAGRTEEQTRTKGITFCDYPGCTREFKDDFSGHKVNAHKRSHRKALQEI